MNTNTSCQNHWSQDSLFYHMYPLGLCGAPEENDFSSPPVSRLKILHQWGDHLNYLGINALYLGPVFESLRHGYDVVNPFEVDRRLGTREDLQELVEDLHQRGIKVIFDGVFNHVGRNFHGFQDLLEHREKSSYACWFAGIDFQGNTPAGDGLAYEGWNGNYDLVRLNPHHPPVRQFLLDTASFWIDTFNIDGIRLDAADCLDKGFLRDLEALCREKKSDFWLMGEVVMGDYRPYFQEGNLHSVTNYEIYKGLWSSLNDANFYELSYGLNRQFGPEGIYRKNHLYSFADNHDVNRVASTLHQREHLYPLYGLLYTLPGCPSLYYGSEFGLQGKREPCSDAPLRPCLNLGELQAHCPVPELPAYLKQLGELRLRFPALRYGTWREIYKDHQDLVFLREIEGQQILVLVNSRSSEARIYSDEFPEDIRNRSARDCFSGMWQNPAEKGKVPPCGIRVVELA